MDRNQAASTMILGRPLLGQMAMATVLVGSVAALSSAGIAVPVSKVGFAKDWNERAPAATRFSPLPIVAAVPPSVRMPVPYAAPALTRAPALPITVAAPRSAITLAEHPAPMTRIDPVQQSRLVQVSAAQIPSVLGATVLAPSPVEAPVVELATAPAPLAVPVEAPAGLAVSAPVPVPEALPLSDEAKPVPAAAAPLRLVNPPELRGFDLARVPGQRKSVPPGFAQRTTKPAVSGTVEVIGTKDKLVGEVVYHQLTVMVAGSDGKSIDVRIGADMKPSIKVGDLLGLVSDRMDPESAARFAAASSAGDYVSLATLRAAGFDVNYNAGTDSISISAAQ